MISLDEAREYVLSLVEPLPAAAVPLAEARGLVLADAVIASEAVPPFANTAMDGFAVRAADTGRRASLRIVGTLAAGATFDGEVQPGEAVRIMTGAPMPDGADAVVMVELCTVEGDNVTVAEAVPVGNHVRPAGDDMAPGDEVLTAGTVLSPGALGVLATLGISEPFVILRPRVGVMSTGDELVDGPSPLQPGQIRDSNRRTILALVEESGFSGVDLGLVRDDEDAIAAALELAAAGCDAVLTTGGVSMGDFDFVKVVLDRIGDMRWMQVAIKPAKPLAAGRLRTTPIIGLPGNPVSSMISFELFARPALRKMAGHADLDRRRVRAVVEGGLRRKEDGKIHFARVSMSQRDDLTFVARSAGGQGSHHTAAMAHADGLAILPDGDGIADGDTVEVIVL